MSSTDAQYAHQLAAQINAARARGDLVEANRLVALFNESLSTPPAPSGSKGGNISEVPETPITQLNQVLPDLSKGNTHKLDPDSPPVPAPIQPGSLAEAVMKESQVVNNQEANNIQNAADPFSYLQKDTANVPANLPIGEELGSGNIVNEPHVPDVKELLSKYAPGVAELLDRYLKEFSAELETPEAVLGPLLFSEFERLWRERQMEEALLLKLPEHIQQRSVLLRFRDELIERLK